MKFEVENCEQGKLNDRLRKKLRWEYERLEDVSKRVVDSIKYPSVQMLYILKEHERSEIFGEYLLARNSIEIMIGGDDEFMLERVFEIYRERKKNSRKLDLSDKLRYAIMRDLIRWGREKTIDIYEEEINFSER